MIGSVSTRSFFNEGTVKSQNNMYDAEIKSLQDQKTQIQKQIDQIKSGSANTQIKEQLISALKEQMEQIDSQIQQKQMERFQQQKTNGDNENSNQVNADNAMDKNGTHDDYLLMDMAASYKSIKKVGGIKTSLESSAAVLREEANLDEGRDKFHHAGKQIAEKRAKANENIAHSNTLNSEISKQSSRIDEDIKYTVEYKDDLTYGSNIENENDIKSDDGKVNGSRNLEKMDKKSLDTLA
jgi:hypothetical protein